jgi:predicted  nucleic acid-binding Zn-ribbon protein
MATPAEIFREIHRLRRYLKDLNTRHEQAPKLQKQQADKLARQEEGLKQAHDAIKHLKVHIHEKDVSIRTEQDIIRKYEKQLKEMITSKKEYDALTHEIAQAKATIGKLEDEALAMIGESEERAAKLPEIEATVKKAREDFAKFEQDQAESLRRYDEEKARSEAELKAAEASLAEDIRTPYLRLAAAKGADALASVQHGTCAACYTEVTPQMASDLRRGLYLVCKMCGRILYAE